MNATTSSQPPSKLRLLFAVAFGAVLIYRIRESFLPPDFPPLLLYTIAIGAPLAAILLAYVVYRGVVATTTRQPSRRD